MRILFVAMSESIHTVRWIRQLSGRGWDIHLFPSWTDLIHPEHKDVTIHTTRVKCPGLDPSVRLRGGLSRPAQCLRKHVVARIVPRLEAITWLPRPLGILRNVGCRWVRGRLDEAPRLARVIERIRPDVIHSLEIQHAGYLTLAARELHRDKFPPWIVTNWGNDTYFFGRLKRHVDRIRSVFHACDFYDCECRRDVKAARDLGFRGEAWPVAPNTGGFHLDEVRKLQQPGPTSARRFILVKGYQSWAGRSLCALRAIELCADVIRERGYRVGIYLPNDDVRDAAELIAHDTGIPFEIIPHVSHEEMLRNHGRARVSIGCSITDGVATSFLEALVMGAFPIQSFTACADEWIDDGMSGSIIHPMDPEGIARALRRALVDDALVDRAAAINARTADERLEYSKVQAQAIDCYERVMAKVRGERETAFPDSEIPCGCC